MAGSDRGGYAKPLLRKYYRLTCGCVSPNFRPETTFSKVAGGRVRTADLQTRRLALNPLLHGDSLQDDIDVHVLYFTTEDNRPQDLYPMNLQRVVQWLNI